MSTDWFSGRAATYAAIRPDYPPALFRFVASLGGARRLAWDCGTGNGQAAVALAEHFDLVIATDRAEAQLAHARPHPRVEYRQASAESSGLPAASADVVTVAQALHWFDLDRFYAEVRRVVRPGGAIVVWSYGDPVLRGGPPALDAALQRFNHETLDAYWPPERGAVGAGYLSLPFPFDELPAPAMTLERRWTRAELLAYLRSWSATARYIAMHDADPTAMAESALAPHWGGDEVRHVVEWPLIIRAGRVTA